jgi:hypothetical protein
MTWIFWTAVYLIAQFVFALSLGHFIQQGRRQRRVVAQATPVRANEMLAAWRYANSNYQQ